MAKRTVRRKGSRKSDTIEFLKKRLSAIKKMQQSLAERSGRVAGKHHDG